MALLPLKQTVILKRKGEVDRWGNEITPPVEKPMKCRIDEGSKVVQNSLGEEVVAGMEITFDKLADIQYTDTLEYTNELGKTIVRNPIRVEVVRAINGKPLLTVVYT